MFFVLVLLISAHFSINCFELNEYTARLLQCPINSKPDLDFLYNLITDGHNIDIFREKVIQNEKTVLDLITDDETSEILLGQAGCFEEKSRSALKRLYTTSNVTNKPFKPQDFHKDYRSHEGILEQLNYYLKTYPEEVKMLKSIGKSHEGRDLMVIHLTSNSQSTGNNPKPLVWIMAGQHAREWIAPAATMYFIELLLLPKNRDILNQFEFAVMPLVNPDGYEYSRSRNRLWRKNRGRTFGVDLNRNWDHRWCELGSSKNPRVDNYCGPGPASEPEIESTQNYILSLSNRIIGFDIHSHGQLILRNFGWTSNPSPDESIFSDMSRKMSKNMQDLHGVHYQSALSAGLYPSTGSADDWLYVKANIPGFVLELRDKGKFGFSLPKSQIAPTGDELYAAIITAITSFTPAKLSSYKAVQ